MLYKNVRLFIFLFGCVFFNQIAYGQLANFTLQVSSANETCTANATLSFTVSGTTPGAILLYRIYKLPNTTTPIAVTNNTTFGGLTAGNYRVEAIQSLGALSNTQQQDVVITNLITPVTFLTTGQPATYCGTTGTITANVNQGTPVAYEIISGPVIVALQPSNVFTGLAPGDYVIRVIDACGDGVVQAYHLPIPPPNLAVTIDQGCDIVTCNTKSFQAQVTALAGTAIGYPLQVQFTIVPQGGTPIVFSQTISGGNASLLSLPFTFPFVDTLSYVASIKVTDACGNIKISSDTPLLVQPTINLEVQALNSCTEAINIGLCNLLPPFMVEFLSAPAGFVPVNFNSQGLGPFNTSTITYASTAQNELPVGHYSIKVTDSCGRTVQGTAEVVKGFTDHKVVSIYNGCDLSFTVVIPDVGISPTTVIMTSAPAAYTHSLPYDLSNTISGGIFSIKLNILGTYVFEGINECGDPYIRIVTLIPPMPRVTAVGSVIPACSDMGRITVKLLGAPAMASVVIIQAPPTLTQPLPYNVSSFIISPMICIISGLPVGEYTLVVTDICGTVYPPVTATISPGVSGPPSIEFLRGCALGEGSMRMKSINLKYVQVIITAAPPGFSYPLPYNVSFNIEPLGVFYMNSLPEGVYTFHTKDICAIEQDVNVTLPGYDIIQNDVNLIGNCGSFDLFVSHRVGDPVVHGLWLQKYNPLTGQWGHPLTGVPYIEATIPTTANSYFLINNATNYNIAAYGTFRVLKYNIYYSNGRTPFENCFNVIREFVFNGDLSIDSASTVPCNNSSYDVIINASGIAPFTYKITSKNGVPFLINNGNSSLFAGLTPGIYNFQVQDLCGNIVNRLFDITTLSEPTITADSLCIGQNGQLAVAAVSFLSYQWWKGTATGTILSTTNTLSFSPFSNATSPGTYYVRIYSTSNLSCIDITISYVVPEIITPKAGLDGLKSICGSDNSIDLFTLLGAPFDNGGIWSEITTSGVLSNNIWSPAGILYGVYTFKYTVNGLCGLHDDAIVIIHYNPAPDDPVITTGPNFCNTQNIQLNVDSIPNATYQWTGPNGFLSEEQNPIITNTSATNSGLYSVSATVDGCDSNASVTLNIVPTPNFEIKPLCVIGIYTLSIIPINNSFSLENASYSWVGPLGFTSTENPLPLSGFPTGLYQVTVTNSDGCFTTHSIEVNSTVCSIPNVITPNGDDYNNDFDLTGLNVRRIEIYSRWGRLVYEQNDYINQWHGQNMHNKELPDSTYYYILFLKTGEEKQGWVYKSSWH